MKCHKPNTDQELEITVLANGVPCDEYALRSTGNSSLDSDPNVLECFVAVSEGDQLTLSGAFTGSVLHASFDVLADGSFLGDKRIEGPKTGLLKYYKKRKLDVKKIFDLQVMEFATDTIVEGNMHVKALREDYQGSPLNVEAKALGVGSLALVCSLNQDTTENYAEPYPSSACGDWALRGQEDVTDGGIGPTFEMEVKVTDDDVSKTRQQKHKRHLAQTRFGVKPWAKFIFHYRSRSAIDEAGCEERSADSQALEPGDDTFVHATVETPKKGTAGGTRSRRKTADPEDDEITVASMRSGTEARDISDSPSPTSRASLGVDGFGLPATPVPEAPKMEAVQESSLGKRQRVVGQDSGFGESTTAASETQRDVMTAQHDADSSGEQHVDDNGLGRISPFVAYNEKLEQQIAADDFETHVDGTTLPGMSDVELANAIAGTRTFLHAGSQHVAPAAQMVSQAVAPAAQMVAAPAQIAEPVIETLPAYDNLQGMVPVAQVTPAQEGDAVGMHADEANDVNAIGLQGQEQGQERSVQATAPSLPASRTTDDTTTTSTTIHTQPATNNSDPNGTTPPPSPSLAHLTTSMTSPPPPPSHAVPSPQPSQTYLNDLALSSCTLTPDQIAPHIPPQGIKIAELKQCFTEEELPSNQRAKVQFWQMVRVVARNVDELYYLKTLSQGSQAASAQSQRLTTPAGGVHKVDVVEEDAVPDSKPTKSEEEPEVKYKERTPPAAAQQHNPTPPPSTTSKKRTASAMAAASASRSSTPSSSKKARPNALAAKKAELLAQLEGKRLKRVAAQEALLQQQGLREREEVLRERAEVREIEMLEALARGEDEELEVLERKRAEEVEWWEEAKRAREDAEESVRAASEGD
ncbi:hypothetical protein LTR08_008866 [Meristemomyces frigidus]|nr:hypothetical protein LTR08_008866 [Meristemomyces frigidus]